VHCRFLCGYSLFHSSCKLQSTVKEILQLCNLITQPRSWMRERTLSPYLWTLRSPGIDSKESIPTTYVSWRPGTIAIFVVPARQAGGIDASDSIPGLLKCLQIRALDLIEMPSWGGIFKLLWSPGIDCKESIPPAYLALAGRYDNRLSKSHPSSQRLF
jgi:hypothetical protein